MGVVLPGWADEILDIIGVSWPNVDEDDYRGMADALREFADDIEHGANEAHQVIEGLVGSAGGSRGVEALNAHWGKINGKHLKGLADCGRLAATAMDGVAVLIEGAKLAAIVQLGILAAEVIAAQAAAPFTFGLSELGALAGTQATRLAVRKIIKEVCQQVVEQVVSVALTPVEEALGAMVGDLVVQLGANALGMQKGVDLGHAAQAGKDAGKSAASGMQLLSAGSSVATVGGGGGSFTFDPDAHDNVVTGLQGASNTFHTKAGGKLGRAKSHHGRTRGKDVIANAAAPMIDKVMENLVTCTKKTAKHLGDDMTSGVKQMKKNHQDNDSEIALSMAELKKRDGGTPMYLMGDDATVRRLHSDGSTSNLTDEDRKRIGLNFNGDNVGRPQAGEPIGKLDPNNPKPRPRHPSQQVAPGSTPLSRATQLARHSGNSYGSGAGTPNNYAAMRVNSAGGNGDFIMVGRSSGFRHSEKMLGVPFLRNSQEGRIRELYTERGPCTEGGSQCSQWMNERLSHVSTSHSFDYKEGVTGRAQMNADVKAYLAQLKANR
ncbi:nucleic acid/nucleotide deaminase domain-containing protein [Streptomyces sp. WAC01526]|uniref:WXG100-like domain-containing protein n=1 Tax=Streptomyces sp. WAC01526 TaxID=2588709 RepID=UPI00165219DA|nr:nucleic acid/nucleotide deaminase domain-containing protein [Streptomyces sp. WAC01526]